MTAAHPVVDTEAALSLGQALRNVGYSDVALDRLIGEDDSEEPLVAERRLPRSLLGTVVRALYLRLRVPTDDLARALGRVAVEALASMGLAEVGADVVARVRILPVGNLLIASDDPPGASETADYVAAYTPTSRLVDSLTPRLPVERALDVGTGSGVQALLAARHARHVIATDVNERALAYTALNAALSGLTNVECRQGPFFEPVADEKFDLITCNAPYVISPEMRLTYRDAGLRADEVSERIVRGAAERLTEGGFASLLVSWLADDEDEPDDRVLEWTENTGCDSWILPVWGADPLGHAATWNEPLSGDDEALGAALDSWTDYLRELGAHWVTEGAVLLHRHDAPRHTVRVDELDEDEFEDASEQVERAFAARVHLAELNGASELLEWRLRVAMPLQLEHELEPRSGRAAVVAASIQLAEGTSSSVDATPRTLDVVASLDGKATLEEAVHTSAARLGLSPAETTRLRRDALQLARELLELGALEFRTASVS
jgi:methylase of polypeptide subunit release factors